MDAFAIFQQAQYQRVSDGAIVPLLSDCELFTKLSVLVWPQLGDFDTLEYAWWLQREALRIQRQGLVIRAVGIGSRASGQQFCQYTGFPASCLFVDPKAELHQKLNLYPGLSLKLKSLSTAQNAWMNLMLMCAGIGSPGTLAEVFRGYWGDRRAPQLIGSNEVVQAKRLPPLKGSNFNKAGGKGFQRPA